MPETLTEPVHEELIPPQDFVYDPDLMESYSEQVENAKRAAEYQAMPLRSFEHLPQVDVQPVFNPTDAPPSEIYAHNRIPRDLGVKWRIRSEWVGDDRPVTMWRVVDRSKLSDGTALVSSRIRQNNSLGDVEGFAANLHMLSYDELRASGPDSATPFVSFSTDPDDLAKTVILKHGYGIKQGQDAVVVQVTVSPTRVITENKNKSDEVLLLGGVAPEEYNAAYEITDFVKEVVGSEEMIPIGRDIAVPRDVALERWALIAREPRGQR